MFYCKTPKGEFVFEKGSPGESFFVIENGEVEVIIKEGQILKTLERGSYFGDLSLLYNAPRSAGIKVWDGVKRNRMTGEQVMKSLQTLGEIDEEFEDDKEDS